MTVFGMMVDTTVVISKCLWNAEHLSGNKSLVEVVSSDVSEVGIIFPWYPLQWTSLEIY